MSSLTEQLVDFVLGIDYDAIPPDVIDKAKSHILDGLGTTLGGSVTETGDLAAQYVAGQGDVQEATLVGRGAKGPVEKAALFNGLAGHVLDYDDTSWSMVGHPTVVVMPAALGTAELLHAGGKDFLAAYALGVEVACKLGKGVNPPLYERGYHSTAAVGVFGATVAAGKLLGLTRDQFLTAFGIAASESGGLRANFGSMTKSLHAGRAAEKGVFAARLAKLGYTASKDIMEVGFCKVIAGKFDLNKIVEGLGSPFDLVSPGIDIKVYPSCAGTHPAIDAVLVLRRENGLSASKIEGIDCGTDPQGLDMLRHHDPKNGLEAKFSMEYCLAVAMVKGQALLPQFTDEAVKDTAVRDLMKRTKVHIDEEYAAAGYSSRSAAKVTVYTKDGEKLFKEVRLARGHPQNPISKEEGRAKFFALAEPILGSARARSVMETVGRLDGLGEIGELTSLL